MGKKKPQEMICFFIITKNLQDSWIHTRVRKQTTKPNQNQLCRVKHIHSSFCSISLFPKLVGINTVLISYSNPQVQQKCSQPALLHGLFDGSTVGWRRTSALESESGWNLGSAIYMLPGYLFKFFKLFSFPQLPRTHNKYFPGVLHGCNHIHMHVYIYGYLQYNIYSMYYNIDYNI